MDRSLGGGPEINSLDGILLGGTTGARALLRKTAMNGRNTDPERLRNGSRAMPVGGQSSNVV